MHPVNQRIHRHRRLEQLRRFIIEQQDWILHNCGGNTMADWLGVELQHRKQAILEAREELRRLTG